MTNGGSGGLRVSIHYAQTLDGRIATCTGDSRWVSCEQTLKLAHQLRAEHDAVMVGLGTVLADDPQLTVRRVPGRSPLRVILDSTLQTPPSAQAVNDPAAGTLLLTTDRADPAAAQALRARGAAVTVLGQDRFGRIDLSQALIALSDLGVSSVLVEGGATLITALLRERLAQRLVVCIAPKIVGAGLDAVGGLDIMRMDEAIQLADVRITTIGGDIVVDARPVYASVSSPA
jgi:riboflavin-specific deaminase-like protein